MQGFYFCPKCGRYELHQDGRCIFCGHQRDHYLGEKLGFFKGLYYAIVICSIFWLLVGFIAYAIWGLS